MKRITIIDGHPDPSPRRLNHTLADRYAEEARACGSEVRRIDVAQLDFPFLRKPEDFVSGETPPAIATAQRDIAWADHVVFFYPMWISDVPSLLKAFIEQTFRPGFAMEYAAERRLPRKLLSGKSARLVVTMGMPAPVYRWVYGEHMVRSYRAALKMCGISPVEQTLIGGVGEASECRVRTWLHRIAQAARYDSAGHKRAIDPLRAVVAAAAGAYLAYAGATWLRYGTVRRTRGSDALLDGVMPAYEVAVRHAISVDAPADVTFEAMTTTDFERSPVVRAIFRARELLLHAKHSASSKPGTLMEQIAAFGWSVVAEDHGREIVLATVTQPWRPNPVFRSLPASEFTGFSEPGYAKIAFTLRVEPLSDERCEASTETRVQTTDAASRALFRSYWAFLSPGIHLIRRLLLQQIKSEAEPRAAVASALSRESGGAAR